MGLNDTPSANRVHIGFFGRRNAGKSSLVNAVTGQKLSVVSDTLGTTTDPVYKAMELLPLGPVLIMDTPGMDDEGALGALRVEKAKQVLRKTDIAVLVVDGTAGMAAADRELIRLFEQQQIPYLTVFTRWDLMPEKTEGSNGQIPVSTVTGEGIHELKEKLAHIRKDQEPERRLVADLVQPLDVVVLVIPIDASAPKGRLILPQQQVIRDLLETGAIPVCVRETELRNAIKRLGTQPALVITDSQAFKQVAAIVPEEVPLTSFSILMARWKGFLHTAAVGVQQLEQLEDGDCILIAEGCTHHRQCEDIGTVKLPNWIRRYTGKDISFSFCSGGEFPEKLDPYRLVIHCGACMLNEREVCYRERMAAEQGIPFTNYGTAIAYMNGIFARSVQMLPEMAGLF